MITREGDRLVLTGRLTMSTVPGLYEAGLQQLADDDLLVDFSKVEAVDSSAVSMLLCWARAAEIKKRSLRVTGLPDGLMSLANLYGVSEMMPGQAGV